MKRFILILSALLFSFTSYADEYAFKISGGHIEAPLIASEINLDKNNEVLEFVDYEGTSGYEGKIGILIGHLEFNYLHQYYEAEKDRNDEKGKIEFSTETTSILLYFMDAQQYKGFNASLGVGKGVTHLRINTQKNGNTVIDNGVVYAKEIHGQIGLHYGFTDYWGISYNYMQSTMSTVTGSDFTNVISSVSIDLLF